MGRPCLAEGGTEGHPVPTRRFQHRGEEQVPLASALTQGLCYETSAAVTVEGQRAALPSLTNTPQFCSVPHI